MKAAVQSRSFFISDSVVTGQFAFGLAEVCSQSWKSSG